VFAVLGNERYPAVANIGLRPTLYDSGQRTVETHIFGFDEDIHGCDLVVEFVSRLRDERRFEQIDDLIAQIKIDSQAARRILSQTEEEVDRHGPALDARRYRFREQEHTADRALRVWGRGLADLLVGAARGMCTLMGDSEDLVPEVWRTIRLQADDREALLVEWLNELLYLVEAEGLLFIDFRIESVTDSGTARAGAGGATMVAHVGGAVAPVTRGSIKAATFHDLKLVEDAAGWSTVITFDV
jgi:SHS2 domain-containing protein